VPRFNFTGHDRRCTRSACPSAATRRGPHGAALDLQRGQAARLRAQQGARDTARTVKAPAGCYWENDVLYWRIKVNGREKRGSLYTSDPAIAKQRRQAKKAELVGQARFGEDVPTRFEDVLEKWGANLIKSGAPSTHTRYLCSMDQMKPYLSGKTLSQITKRLLNDMVEERQKEVTNATIRRDLTALSKLFGYAIGRDWCENNPAQIVWASISEDRDPINLPHDDDIALVMNQATGPYPYLMRAALLSGCRIEELVNATRRDFDPVAKTLTIKKAKHNSARIIDLSWNNGHEFFASLPAFAGKPWLFWRHEDKRVRSDSEREPTFKGDKIEDASQNFRRFTDAIADQCAETGKQFVRFVFHDLPCGRLSGIGKAGLRCLCPQ
jgi:integrase/recombinase XerD